jgi:thioredoxin reductase
MARPTFLAPQWPTHALLERQQMLAIRLSAEQRGDMDEFDVVVVGGGAAGLNAALVLARARRRVLVVDEGRPRNAPAAHAHGYLTRDGIPPPELLAIGRAEVEAVGATVVADRVVDARRDDSGLRLDLDAGEAVRARAVLVATGLVDELPPIDGLRERWGRDVLHCPYCHGYEVRDQPIGVLATSPLSIQQAFLVRQWSEHVVLFLHTSDDPGDEAWERLAARGVAVVNGEVAGLEITNDRLTGVRLSSGRVVPRTAVFVAPFFRAQDAVLTALGAEIQHTPVFSQVVVDADGATSVQGVWAAGNVADARAHIIAAAAAGARSAAAINAHLVEEDVDRAVRKHREPAFSRQLESRVCEQVVGDARHGL